MPHILCIPHILRIPYILNIIYTFHQTFLQDFSSFNRFELAKSCKNVLFMRNTFPTFFAFLTFFAYLIFFTEFILFIKRFCKIIQVSTGSNLQNLVKTFYICVTHSPHSSHSSHSSHTFHSLLNLYFSSNVFARFFKFQQFELAKSCKNVLFMRNTFLTFFAYLTLFAYLTFLI